MYQVKWFDEDQHVRVYDEAGNLVSIFPKFFQAEEYLDSVTWGS